MNYRNFARLILRKTQRLLIITIFFMTYSLTSAHIIEEKGGFALTLSSDCFLVPNAGQFSRAVKEGTSHFGEPYRLTENDYSENKHENSSTGINFTLHSYFNDEDSNKDMGFYGMSQLVIHGYEGHTKYIKSVDIKWSKLDEQDDYLWLKAKKDVPSKTVYSNLGEMGDEECDLEVYLESPADADVDKNMNQTIVFDKPVNYLILTKSHTANTDEKRTAQWIVIFESITIHFTDEDPTVGEREPKKLTLCDGKDQISMPWTKEELNLDNVLSIEGVHDLQSGVEEMDLRFYLTPEFTPAERPDYTRNKVEDMTDWEWYLFTLLERNGQVYDGFLTVDIDNENRIECKLYDAESNSLTLPLICSGLYSLSVESGNSEVTSNKVLLNIYPDIIHAYTVFETDEDNLPFPLYYEFSLNGVTFGQNLDSKVTLGYPYADNTDYSKGAFEAEAIIIDIPGLYDADLYYRIEIQEKSTQDDGPSDLSKRGIHKLAPNLEGYILYTEEKPSLVDLNENNEATLQLKIVKNNAVTPDNEENDQSIYTLKLRLDASVDIPTAVDTISTEFVNSGKARYYNLNGVEVNSRTLPSGIYIKVENGKAEKLVIR